MQMMVFQINNMQLPPSTSSFSKKTVRYHKNNSEHNLSQLKIDQNNLQSNDQHLFDRDNFAQQQITKIALPQRHRFGIKNRKDHMMIQFKQKYQRMIQLQHKSFIEKNELEKERNSLLILDQNKIKSKVLKVKQSVDKQGSSSRSWKQKNMEEGASIRIKKLVNEHMKFQRESIELQKKKSIVSQMQKSISLSRQRILQRRGESTSRRRQLQIYQQYKCGQIQKIKNIYQQLQPRISPSTEQLYPQMQLFSVAAPLSQRFEFNFPRVL